MTETRTVMASLDALCAAVPGVETAVYMDMNQGTVLCASARVQVPQERLDTLCAMAATLLGQGEDREDEALILSATETLLLHRARRNAGEALGVVCAPGGDLADTLARTRETLDSLAEAA